MRLLRFIHRWLGILLALPLILQGLSGAILTLEPLIPERGGLSPAQPTAAVDAILAAARAVAPAGMRLSRYTPPAAAGDAATVYFAPENAPRGPGLVLQLDPATATPLGPPRPVDGVFAWVKRLHTSWFAIQWGGRQLAGWFGIGLFLLTVLGIPLWWPRGTWRDGFTVPRAARGMVLYRRLHGAAGIWLWLMLLVTSTTGIIEAFPQTSRAVLGLPAGRPPGPGRAAIEAPAPIPDLGRALALAEAAAPGAALRVAMLPASAREPIRLILGPPGSEGVTTATTVTLDASGARVLSVNAAKDAPAGEAVMRWAHDLHFGQAFGPFWRAFTTAVGLSLPLFSVTGLLMWLRRRRNLRRVDTMRRAAVHAGE